MDDVTQERWLPVVGFEGLYEDSDLGRVRSLDRLDAAGRRWPGRIMKPQVTNTMGHLKVSLRKDGKSHQRLIHRLVMESFAGPCPEGMEVRHLDGDPANNQLGNLAYGTHQDNMRDLLRYGIHHNTAKDRCPKGHEYTEGNTLIGSHGERNCKICHREMGSASWKRLQERMRSDPEVRARENAKAAARARARRARLRDEREKGA